MLGTRITLNFKVHISILYYKIFYYTITLYMVDIIVVLLVYYHAMIIFLIVNFNIKISLLQQLC